MIMFLIQALLWLLIAFLLGYGIGRFLKSLFCRGRTDVDMRHAPLSAPKVDRARANTASPGISATAASVLGGTAAAAAAAGAVPAARSNPVEVDAPDMALTAPKMDMGLPEVEVTAPVMDLSDIDPHKPIETDPYKTIEVDPYQPIETDPYKPIEVDPYKEILIDPHRSIETDPYKPIEVDPYKEILIDPYKSIETDPHKPIEVDPYQPIMDLPEVDVSVPETGKNDGSGLLDIAKGAVAAAGAGLAAKAVAAASETRDVITEAADTIEAASGDLGADTAESGDDTNWLLVLVQRIKDEYQGHNPRAVSKLWSAGSSTYDCSTLDENESLTLQPAQYDKLGITHCGVPHAGFVAVGGDVSSVEQGGAVLFHYPDIVVCRDHEDNHHFIRITD